MALGQRVEVERDLLGRVGGALAAVDRILLARLGPRVVQPAPEGVRDGLVVLLDAGQHLAVERLAERGGRLRQRLGVGVLRLQVGDDVGRVLLAQPGVVVLERVAVDDGDLGDFLRDGRNGPGHLEMVRLLDELPVRVLVENLVATELVNVAASVIEDLAVGAATGDPPHRDRAWAGDDPVDVVPAQVADELGRHRSITSLRDG